MEEYNVRIAYFLILSFSIILVASQGSASSSWNKSWATDPLTLDNQLMKYYTQIKDDSDSDNDEEVSTEPSQDFEGSDNETVNELTDEVVSDEGSDNETSIEAPGESEANQNVNESIEIQNQTQHNNQEVNIQNNIQMKQRLEIIISEEEGEVPIPIQEQNSVESKDRVIETQHKALTGPGCRSGNILAGASNAEDLRLISECQDATGTVMHTKKMDDGDYKFFLNLDEKFKFLANEKNKEKTDGFLVVEIVPPDQGANGIILPKEGDHVHVWGAWVTDKPKGWHEIHPTTKVVNE